MRKMIWRVCIWVICCLSALHNFGQGSTTDSLYTERSVLRFCQYLMANKEYKMASEEYKRLYFLVPGNRSYFKSWIQAQRLAGDFEGLSKSIDIDTELDSQLAMEYIMGAIRADKMLIAQTALNQTKVSADPKTHDIAMELQQGMSLLMSRRPQHIILPIESRLISYKSDYTSLRRKNPFVAGLMSTAIPSAGRMYAGDYKNGLISLLFVATMGYQSYRRFEDRGINSVGGWIYGGIAAGFYVANIYGSVRAAQNYNAKKRKVIDDKLKVHLSSLTF
jgi:hypothetical protein